MYWNHRVIKYTLPDNEPLYSVREVFYDEHDSDPPSGHYAYVDDPDGVQAESLDGLREYIGWMLKALDQPVLTPSDFGLSEGDAISRREVLAEAGAILEALHASVQWELATEIRVAIAGVLPKIRAALDLSPPDSYQG